MRDIGFLFFALIPFIAALSHAKESTPRFESSLIQAKLPAFSPSLVPTQVVIENASYLETIVTRRTTLNFKVFSGSIEIAAPVAPVWSISNSHMQIYSTGTQQVVMTAMSTGATSVTVTVGAVTSQPVLINVLSFSSGTAVATKVGRYFGSNVNNICFFLNRAIGNSYEISPKYYSLKRTVSTGDQYSQYVGSCFDIHMPKGQTSAFFSAKNASGTENISYTKLYLFTYYGRNGFLYFPFSSSPVDVRVLDDRFFEWDEDFSITYWTLRGLDGSIASPGIDGKVRLGGGFRGLIALYGSSSSAYINSPSGGDYQNRWSHIGLVFKASDRSLKYYVDGDLIGAAQVPTDEISPSARKLIQFYGWSVATAIDDLRFWNVSLSGSEISNELTMPESILSNRILASFNFDAGFDGVQNSENGSGWTFDAVTDLIQDSSPRALREEESAVNQGIFANTEYSFEHEIKGGDFSFRKARLFISKAAFVDYTDLFLQISDCFFGCSQRGYVDGLVSGRISPYAHLVMSNGTRGDGEILLSLPFDTQGITKADLPKIRVLFLSDQGQYEASVPYEIDFRSGTISFVVKQDGYYWLTIPEGIVEPRYVDSNLMEVATQSWRRLSYVRIPSAQTTYELAVNGVSPGSAKDFVCTPGGFNGSSLSFPISISNLAVGDNYCFFEIEHFGGYSSVGMGVNYRSSHVIHINRGAP